MLANKLRASYLVATTRPLFMTNQVYLTQAALLTQYQAFQFGNLQGRINRRLRRYRQDKIQNESSFNKNEGKQSHCLHDAYSFECLLLQEGRRCTARLGPSRRSVV